MTSAKLLVFAKKALAIILVFLFSVSIPTTVFATSDEITPEIPNEEVEEGTDAEAPTEEEKIPYHELEDCPNRQYPDCPYHEYEDCPFHEYEDCPDHEHTDCPYHSHVLYCRYHKHYGDNKYCPCYEYLNCPCCEYLDCTYHEYENCIYHEYEECPDHEHVDCPYHEHKKNCPYSDFSGYSDDPYKGFASAFLEFLFEIADIENLGYFESSLKTFFSAIYELILSIFDGSSETAQIKA